MGQQVVQSASSARPSKTPAPASSGSASAHPLLPGLILVAVGCLAAMAVNQLVGAVSTLLVAVVIGALIGNSNVASAETAPGLAFAAKRVLRWGVVLLGLRLSISQVTALGLQTLLIVLATVTMTFFGVQWLGRRLGLSPGLSLLVGSGFSICGLSAIAAVEGSADAEEEEVAAAMGLVTLFGSLAIFAVPAVGNMIGLSDVQLGTWVGASVHDTAQVVAAASAGGSAVLTVAIAVKLTRVLLLAPIVAFVNLRGTSSGPRPALLPGFVAAFLLMILVRSSGVLPEALLDSGKALEGLALAAAMVGLGANVKIDRIRMLGPKPLVLGVVAWIVVGVISLSGVLFFA